LAWVLLDPPYPLTAALPTRPLTFLGSSLIILDTFAVSPYQKIFRKKILRMGFWRVVFR
jgi:hypothetical protein